MSMALLQLEHLDRRFGGLAALEDLNLTVPVGGLYGLIGPNGAGKTTVFNLISGFVRPSGGRILMNGNDITGEPPHRLTASGIARTFQNIRLFGELSVLDNVLVGFHCRRHATWGEAIFRLPRYRQEEKDQRLRARELLAEVGLADAAHQPGEPIAIQHPEQVVAGLSSARNGQVQMPLRPLTANCLNRMMDFFRCRIL